MRMAKSLPIDECPFSIDGWGFWVNIPKLLSRGNLILKEKVISSAVEIS